MQELYNQAREYAKSNNYKLRFVSGNIYLKKTKSDTPIRVDSEADLKKLRDADILDTSLLPFEGDFNMQVVKILGRVSLNRSEVENLRCLLDDLTEALSCIWPDIRVHPFGSTVTGLGIKTSDLDCYIELPPGYTEQNPVIRARNVLKKDNLFKHIFAITRARVPILKFVHVPTGFNCDINFSNLNGVRNSKLIAFMLRLDSRALPLAKILKYWAKVYNITGTNLLPNYALILMVIFYLQIESVLPSVVELQRHTQCWWVNGWDTAFNDGFVYTSDNTDSLYELLGGFFEYYKSFNYSELVISPYLGYPIRKQQLKDFSTTPTAFSLYIQNVLRKQCDFISSATAVCIQDPFDHSRNCAVAVSPNFFNIILGHITIVLRMYYESPSRGFLRKLFTHNLVYEPVETTAPKAEPNYQWELEDIQKAVNLAYNANKYSPNTTLAQMHSTSQAGYQCRGRSTTYSQEAANPRPLYLKYNENATEGNGFIFWLLIICCVFIWIIQSNK